MGSDWLLTTVGKAFNVNPSRPLKRGTVSPFIPMDVLPLHARAVERIESREYTGTGMRFCNGDTLVARITPCLENGKTAFVFGLRDGEVAHGSTEYIVLSGKPKESDSLFAYYLARSPEFRRYAIGQMEGTSGRQRVPSSAIEKFPVTLPPLQEQRAIAHILGTLDDKIELNRKQNETLEAMARALFKAWFVDFEPVRAKMEGRWQRGLSLPGLPAHLYDLFPDRLVESELGEIPQGWVCSALSDICSFTAGSAFKPEHQGSTEGEYPFIKVSDMNLAGNEVFIQSANNYVSKAQQSEMKAKLHPLGATVFAKIGVALISNRRRLLTSPTIIDNNLMSASPVEGNSGQYFLYSLLSTLDFNTLVSGTALPYINVSDLKKIRIVRPPCDVGRAFEAKAFSMFLKMHTLAAQSSTLATTRDTLLPKLLSGELSVTPAAAEIEV